MPQPMIVTSYMILGHYVEVNVQCGENVVKCYIQREESEKVNVGDQVNLKFCKTHIF